MFLNLLVSSYGEPRREGRERYEEPTPNLRVIDQ